MKYTLPQILDLTGWSRPTFDIKNADGDIGFPEPIDPNAKELLWRTKEIDQWLLENFNETLSDDDRMIMERHRDLYDEAIDNATAQIDRRNYTDPLHEEFRAAEDEAIDTTFEAEEEHWLDQATAEAGDNSKIDIEAEARRLFDEDLQDNDRARYNDLTTEATAHLDRAVDLEIENDIKKTALESVREQLRRSAS